jgi:hypothetical protein
MPRDELRQPERRIQLRGRAGIGIHEMARFVEGRTRLVHVPKAKVDFTDAFEGRRHGVAEARIGRRRGTGVGQHASVHVERGCQIALRGKDAREAAAREARDQRIGAGRPERFGAPVRSGRRVVVGLQKLDVADADQRATRRRAVVALVVERERVAIVPERGRILAAGVLDRPKGIERTGGGTSSLLSTRDSKLLSESLVAAEKSCSR